MPVTRSAGRGVGRVLLLALAAGGVVLGPAPARPKPAPGATAAEREAGRREGQVTYYTARTTTTANTIARKASEALGIKVHIVGWPRPSSSTARCRSSTPASTRPTS